MDFLSKYISKIIALCKKHKVSKLFAFGSVLTNNFNKESDIDLIVDFEDIPLENYVDNYIEFKDALSKILNREVDLLEDKAIRNPILRKSIDNSKQMIYG